ncbi:hypothetical protein N665_1311s0003 [Sinapis alba]|nr:hypothetical protein N665_1311s0003 [Sinapis alba]
MEYTYSSLFTVSVRNTICGECLVRISFSFPLNTSFRCCGCGSYLPNSK